MLIASPQLHRYISELPEPGLLHQDGDGPIGPHDPDLRRIGQGVRQRLPASQSQVATGCGTAKRFTCPYHAWTYDNTGKLVGLPGGKASPRAGPLRRADRYPQPNSPDSSGSHSIPMRHWTSRHTWARSPRNSTRGASALVTAGREVLDSPINWKLAVDTFAENYHFATVHRDTFATIARSNCTVSTRSGRITG